jgi:MerR family transcriptional regulator, heat shock protein HspR
MTTETGVNGGGGGGGGGITEPRDNGAGDTDAHDTRAVYVISVAAELAGVHPQTLRIYERKGLLDPSRTRGGSRRFSERDLAQLRHIQALTTAGLNLQGVRRVLELEAEVARLERELAVARTEAREAVERTHRQYRRDLVPMSQAPVPFVMIRRNVRGPSATTPSPGPGKSQSRAPGQPFGTAPGRGR